MALSSSNGRRRRYDNRKSIAKRWQGNLSFTGTSLTFDNDHIFVVGGDLSLTSTEGDITIDTDNVLAAFSTAFLQGSTGPITGGNVFITVPGTFNTEEQQVESTAIHCPTSRFQPD